MPNKKQFEAMSFTVPFSITYLSMEEVADVYFGHVTHIMYMLKNDKQATVEVPNEERIYKIIRKTSEEFHVKEWGAPGDPVLHTFSANDLLNWVFAKAPFISLVGEEMGPF